MIQPLEQWKPCADFEVNLPANRSPSALVSVLRQFSVERHPRYQRNAAMGATYCNIFLADGAAALGLEGPTHWWWSWSPECGSWRRLELSALATIGWLRNVGRERGWSTCTAAQAREHSRAGRPTCVVWENLAHASSHVAWLLPSPAGGPQLIAQSGAECLWAQPLARGFGSVSPLEYFTHA